MNFIIKVLILALSIFIVGRLVGIFKIKDFSAAFVAAFILALVNIIIKPIMIILTLPITILTLGIFLIFINGFMLIIVSKIVPEFKISGCFTAAIASILISLVSSLIEWLIM